MSPTHFYRRYDPDGRCKVICMHCFQTLGTAWDRHSLEEMESAHLCAYWMEGAPSPHVRVNRGLPSEAPMLRSLLHIPTGLLVLLTVMVGYALPTALEMAARHALNVWLAVILPGDLVGCAMLAGLLRKPRTALLLYLLLTAIEAICHAAGVARGRQLIWFADLIPTLLVLILVLRLKLRAQGLAAS